MTNADQWRRELEAMGEAAIRADITLRGGIVTTGGEDKRLFVAKWLREKEQEREARESARDARESARDARERSRDDLQRQSERYVRWTFWVAIATLVAAVIGVAATALHP